MEWLRKARLRLRRAVLGGRIKQLQGAARNAYRRADRLHMRMQRLERLRHAAWRDLIGAEIAEFRSGVAS